MNTNGSLELSDVIHVIKISQTNRDSHFFFLLKYRWNYWVVIYIHLSYVITMATCWASKQVNSLYGAAAVSLSTDEQKEIMSNMMHGTNP